MTDFTTVPVRWRKSSRSSGGNGNTCVEVGATPTTIAVRDTKFRDGGMLVVDPDAWHALLVHVTDLP